MKKQVSKKIKEIPNIVKVIAGIVTSCGVIFGAVASFCSWIESTIVSNVNERLDGVETTISDIRADTVRLQLLQLLHEDPDNVESILTIAHTYFTELNGDWYMTEMFKKWGRQHDVDLSDFKFAH